MATPEKTLEWLLETGDPVVRWLTLQSLAPDPDPEAVDAAQGALLGAPQVRLWLDRIDGVTRFHNSGSNCFENVAGKLAEFGLRAGIGDLDVRLSPFRAWIAHPDRATAVTLDNTLPVPPPAHNILRFIINPHTSSQTNAIRTHL